MPAEIHDRGRGPEIKGTRITVYDVLDYHKLAWEPVRIAELFRVTVEEVELAIRYIEEHKPEVMAEYQKMLDRDARGNPPEVQAKLDAMRKRFIERFGDRLAASQKGGNGAGIAGGR